MISLKWILIGLAICLIVGIMISEFVIGLVFGSLVTLVADSVSAGKRHMQKSKIISVADGKSPVH